jgi:hypothetical protein
MRMIEPMAARASLAQLSESWRETVDPLSARRLGSRRSNAAAAIGGQARLYVFVQCFFEMSAFGFRNQFRAALPRLVLPAGRRRQWKM